MDKRGHLRPHPIDLLGVNGLASVVCDIGRGGRILSQRRRERDLDRENTEIVEVVLAVAANVIAIETAIAVTIDIDANHEGVPLVTATWPWLESRSAWLRHLGVIMEYTLE